MISKRKGCDTYRYRFMYQGKRVEGSCNTNDKRVAKQVETARRHELALGTAGIKPKKIAPVFKDYALEVFLFKVRVDKAEKQSTIDYYENSVANLLKSPLAAKRLDDITEDDVTEHKRLMQKATYEVSTINCSLRALRRVLNVACDTDVIGKKCKVTLLPGQNKRDFVLTYEDEAEYLAASEPLNRQIATLMLEMGFRPEELHRLEWTQIHSDSITIYKGKGSGSRRTVEMTPPVVSVLTDRGLLDVTKRESQQFVFPTKTREGKVRHIDHSSNKKQHFKAVRAVRKAKAARLGKFEDEINFDFLPYSLRHTFCTRLAGTGLDAPALMYICGHENLATTMNYIHLANVSINDRLREARKKLKTQRVGAIFTHGAGEGEKAS